MSRTPKSAKRFLAVVALAAMLLLLIPVLARHPQSVETIYTRHLYFGLTGLLSTASSALPFSLSEISLYGFAISLVVILTHTLKQKLWESGLKKITLLVAIIISWFYLGWGYNYFRLPLDKQLGLTELEAEISGARFRENLLWCLNSANAHWRAMPNWSLRELDEKIEQSYHRVLLDLNLPMTPGKRRPKLLLVPAVLNYTLTSGIFGPFFHEVHLNSELLPIELPFVLAHEKAHQMGFAREAEANFLAALVCFASADSSVQYSGYFSLLGSFLARATAVADADSLRRLIRPEVRADFRVVRQRYQKYMGTISDMSHATYDAYLRANKIQEGIQNYSGVVELMMRWRAQQGLMQNRMRPMKPGEQPR